MSFSLIFARKFEGQSPLCASGSPQSLVYQDHTVGFSKVSVIGFYPQIWAFASVLEVRLRTFRLTLIVPHLVPFLYRVKILFLEQ